MKSLVGIFVLLAVICCSCQTKYSGIPNEYHTLLDTALVKAAENSEQISLVIESSTKGQKEATAFLVAYMPEKDLRSLTSDFILDQVNGALKVKAEYSWCKKLPDSIFLNEVLPY